MVYVWLVDDLRRQYDTALLASMIGGAEEMPSWGQWREEFDAELRAVPAGADESDRSVLLRGLGLGADR